MQLVTFGEAMLRLTPRDKSFDVYVGGAELNVAVGAAKLGVGARWVSRLPENPGGRMIADRARDEGVDVSCISWTPEGRAGIYYVEVGTEPGRTRVTYDRAGSAMALVAPHMIDWATALGGAKWFHVSGITPALSESAGRGDDARSVRRRETGGAYDQLRPQLPASAVDAGARS